jgi:hypothetical protein
VAQRFDSLVQFEMAQVFLDNGRHGHAQGGGKVLHCHLLLLFRVGQEFNQTTSEVEGGTWFVEFNCYIFALRHLPEIYKIRANDGHAVCAGQMRDTAAPRRGRVGHDRDRRALENIR